MNWDEAARNLTENLPDDIIHVMSSLATVYGDKCFLGGGAVRDLLLNKDIKDWDFYFPYESGDSSIAIANIIKRLLGDYYKVSTYFITDEPITYGGTYLVLSAVGTNTIPNRQLEFIFSGQKITDFDHAICQCSINCKTFQLETTKWFDQCVADRIHRIFTCNLTTPYVTNKAIHDHTKRIQAKYPWPIFLETGVKYNYV